MAQLSLMFLMSLTSIRSAVYLSCLLLAQVLIVSTGLMAQIPAVVTPRSGTELTGSLSLQPGRLVLQPTAGPRRELAIEEIQSLRFERIANVPAKLLPDEVAGLEVLYYPEADFGGQPSRHSISEAQHVEAALRSQASPPTSARWIGQWVPLATGVHHFTLRHTQTARLWIDGQCVGSIRGTNQLRESTGDAFLNADQRYGLVLEVTDAATNSPPTVRCEVTGITSSPLNATRLLHSTKKDPIEEISKGLLATYYGNSTLTHPRLVRVDRDVSMDWKQRAPFPELGVGTRFGVMWEGTVSVPKTGNHRIGLESEGGIRITFDGSIAAQRWEDRAEPVPGTATFPMTVDANRPHPIKIEFFNDVPPARILVNWHPSAGMDAPVMSEGFAPAMPPDASFAVRAKPESPSQARATLSLTAHAGLVLSDGSFVAQAMESATRSQLRLGVGELPTLTPTEWVSRIFVTEVPQAILEKLDPTRPGALLHDGDFVEGDFQSIDASELRMSSILFGSHRIKRDRVAAVVLRSLPRSISSWHVITLTGSVFRPTELTSELGVLKLTGLPSGVLRLPATQILEVRREEPR